MTASSEISFEESHSISIPSASVCDETVITIRDNFVKRGMLNGRAVEILRISHNQLKGKADEMSQMDDKWLCASLVCCCSTLIAGSIVFSTSEKEAGIILFTSILWPCALMGVINKCKKVTVIRPLKKRINEQGEIISQIEKKPRKSLLNSQDFLMIMQNNSFPLEVKKNLFSQMNPQQQLENLESAREEWRSFLLSGIPLEDREMMAFFLSPDIQDRQELIGTLYQYRTEFEQKLYLLEFFLRHVDPLLLDDDEIKSILQQIAGSGESFARLMDESVQNEIEVCAIGQSTVVTVAKLKQYPFFAKYFEKRNSMLPHPKLSSKGKLELALSEDFHDEKIHSILEYIESGHMPEKGLPALMRAADYYMMTSLAVECAVRLLKRCPSLVQDMALIQDIALYCNTDTVFMLNVTQDLQRELKTMPEEVVIQWLLCFRDCQHLNELWSTYDFIPSCRTVKFSRFVFEEKPAALKHALEVKLTNKIRKSDHPAGLLRKFYEIPELRQLLEEEIFSSLRIHVFRQMWEYALEEESAAYQEKCFDFMRQNPAAARQWPPKQLPGELVEALK